MAETMRRNQPRGISAMRTLRPEEDIIADCRAAAHRDIDAIFDALPDIIRLGQSKPPAAETKTEQDPDDPRINPDDIKAKGEHGDPTASQATKTNHARTWARVLRDSLASIQTLNAQIVPLVGLAVCLKCRKEINPDQPTKRNGDRLEHVRCRPWNQEKNFSNHQRRIANLPEAA